MDSHSESHGSNNHAKTRRPRSSISDKEYDFWRTWTCCNCGTGGMTTRINSQCFEFNCGHIRCGNCALTQHKVARLSKFTGTSGSPEEASSSTVPSRTEDPMETEIPTGRRRKKFNAAVKSLFKRRGQDHQEAAPQGLTEYSFQRPKSETLRTNTNSQEDYSTAPESIPLPLQSPGKRGPQDRQEVANQGLAEPLYQLPKPETPLMAFNFREDYRRVGSIPYFSSNSFLETADLDEHVYQPDAETLWTDFKSQGDHWTGNSIPLRLQNPGKWPESGSDGVDDHKDGGKHDDKAALDPVVVRDLKTLDILTTLIDWLRFVISLPFGVNGEPSKGTSRLSWTCRCGYQSFDDFQELDEGVVAEFADELLRSGYITHANVSTGAARETPGLFRQASNAFVTFRGSINGLRSSILPLFSKPTAVDPIALQCLPEGRCRWLHLCLKKRPYATQLESLHVCIDDNQHKFIDATFFKALRKAYYGRRTWRDKALFALRKIQFVEFELCPDNLVDHITPNRLPPTVDEYEFQPTNKLPPIGEEHLMHLFTTCSVPLPNSSLYLRHIPKRKSQALCFQSDRIGGNIGWGLHFVESLNGSLAVTVMFVVSLVLGIVFAVCWSIWKKDVQGAFGVAAYMTSVMTLAVMTWQMWAAYY